MEKFLKIPVSIVIANDTSVAPVGSADLTTSDPIFSSAAVGDIVVDSSGNYYLIASIIDGSNVTLTPLGSEPGSVPISSGESFTLYSASNFQNQIISIDNIAMVAGSTAPGTSTTINYDAPTSADILTINHIPTPGVNGKHNAVRDIIQGAMAAALPTSWPQVLSEVSPKPYTVVSVVLS